MRFMKNTILRYAIVLQKKRRFVCSCPASICSRVFQISKRVFSILGSHYRKEDYDDDFRVVARTNGNWIVGDDGILYEVTDVGRIVMPQRLRITMLIYAHGKRMVEHWGIVLTACRVR